MSPVDERADERFAYGRYDHREAQEENQNDGSQLRSVAQEGDDEQDPELLQALPRLPKLQVMLVTVGNDDEAVLRVVPESMDQSSQKQRESDSPYSQRGGSDGLRDVGLVRVTVEMRRQAEHVAAIR